MAIVVDTNVFVGACLGVGACSAVVAACLRREHTPLIGVALITEYEAVLSRTALFRRCRLSAAERGELLDAFLAVSRWNRIYFAWRPNVPDEADNHLVELAVAGMASHIVSRDARVLRRAELKFPAIRVLTPEQFLKEAAP